MRGHAALDGASRLRDGPEQRTRVLTPRREPGRQSVGTAVRYVHHAFLATLATSNCQSTHLDVVILAVKCDQFGAPKTRAVQQRKHRRIARARKAVVSGTGNEQSAHFAAA